MPLRQQPRVTETNFTPIKHTKSNRLLYYFLIELPNTNQNVV